MPPLNVGGGVGTLRDSGIGDDYPTPSRHGASKDSSNVNLHRNGTDRSSFGMILKVTGLKEYVISIPDVAKKYFILFYIIFLLSLGQIPAQSKYVLSW